MATAVHKAFTPGRIGPVQLRNRFVKAATFEGMSPGGVPGAALVAHHRAIAAGGAGMTTVAYCSVSPLGLTFADQMHMRPELVAHLREVTDAVHAEGAAAALQLGHAGYFADRKTIGATPVAPSRVFNAYGMSFSRPLGEAEIDALVDDYGRAAHLAVEAGFDAVEVHVGHGYLLSQFLSPYTNRRRDRWGGSLENRMRMPVGTVRRVVEEVGERAAVLAKLNLTDGFRGGLTLEESVAVARALEGAGVHAIVPSGGFTSRTPFYMLRGNVPVKEMVAHETKPLARVGLGLFGRFVVKEIPFTELFFLQGARQVKDAVEVPVVLLGGVKSLAGVTQAMEDGFEFVAMGRALIAEPDLVSRMETGGATASRCVPCNLCVAEMEVGGVRCVHLGQPRPLG